MLSVCVSGRQHVVSEYTVYVQAVWVYTVYIRACLETNHVTSVVII